MATVRILGPRNIRRHAFEKLASLAAQVSTVNQDDNDLERLCSLYEPVQSAENDDSETPAMGVRELELVIALARAARNSQDYRRAEKLLHRIGPYLARCNHQTFLHSTCLKTFQPSPWQILTYHVTTAILAIAHQHKTLRTAATSYISQMVDELTRVGQLIADVGIGGSTHAHGHARGHDDRNPVEQAALAVRYCVTYFAFVSAMADRPGPWALAEKTVFVSRLSKAISTDVAFKLDVILSAIVETKPQMALHPWKRLIKVYRGQGLPLGSLLMQRALMKCIAQMLPSFTERLPKQSLLDTLLDQPTLLHDSHDASDTTSLSKLTSIITDFMSLERDELATEENNFMRCSVKANALVAFCCCSSLNQHMAHPEVIMSWLEAILIDEAELNHEELSQVALKCMAVLAATRPALASLAARLLAKLIVSGKMRSNTALVAADCLARALLSLPQDMRISTLYSLGNVLSIGGDASRPHTTFEDGSAGISIMDVNIQAEPSSIVISDTDEATEIPARVVQAIVRIAVRCDDEKITALALSMLLQKLGTSAGTLDLRVVESTAELGRTSSPNDFRSLLKGYVRINGQALAVGNTALLQTVMNARVELARDITKSSPLYEIYMVHLLDAIVSTTGTVQSDTKSIQNGFLGAEGISQIIRPLAVLISREPGVTPIFEHPTTLLNLSRDAWFNLVAHDCLLNSNMAIRHASELETLAMYSPSLIDNDRVSGRESGLDLNTVLRRNNNPAHATQQKQSLIRAFPANETDIKSLDYAELTFLNATHLIAILRARTGDCTRTIDYFLDPKFKSGSLSNVLLAVSVSAVDTYLRLTLSGKSHAFAAPALAQQLVVLFQGCCHRVAKVQRVSMLAVDRIIDTVPSALCQPSSVFAMLELLTLMWSSCLESDTDEYSWRSTYSSVKGNVKVQLSDDFDFRRRTLEAFHKQCKVWTKKVMDIAPLDLAGLLQSYLADRAEEVHGQPSLGRSFALEMGCEIPSTDQRLTSVDRRGGLDIDAASDFLAQYTSRQEYRGADMGYRYALTRSLPAKDSKSMHGEGLKFASQLKEVQTFLQAHPHTKTSPWKKLHRGIVANLCTATSDPDELLQYLVSIPFAILTTDAIQFGISSWMGLIKENPRFGATILGEVASQWELSIRNKRGIFNPHLLHPDPFFLKEEFAPSDRQLLVKKQQHTHDLIAPHLLLVKFLSSHCNATRLCSPSTHRTFFRLARVTLNALRRAPAQPQARELHFHIVLLCLQILAYSKRSSDSARWLLKDQIVSVALTWFEQAPRWSFGGNRLQLKAEVKLMQDVMVSLHQLAVAAVCPSASASSKTSVRFKQDLLLLLLESEIYRLNVWLNPLSHHSPDMPRSVEQPTEEILSGLLAAAWAESASLAIQIALRFPTSHLGSELRQLLLRQPEKALHDPEGLQILLSAMSDNDAQLKYLLYWAPVNPMTAITLFMPEYGHNPFIVQYAMRAFESHSVEVTFFYVPQIVQTLRYDTMSYLERYIIETARFSQLFAHQIIWNMKANAYKDEDSLVPDSMKPILDKVMDALIGSFSAEDRDFYEREFNFFSEVTSISGKLKPYIKRPKPEKKQMIEEELRKIQVDVGVYLPCNPDGVVIGIDRQSGKPLQSHAKAPFMATFRIRKERGQEMSDVDEAIDRAADGQEPRKDASTYEVWQSAIFKVGDDCRQDVLALQMIAAFRGIFNTVGLNVYVFPNRVTATAPGCGVIDVLPNSISRDMLGREQVNGLYEYFVSKYGNEDSLRFQAARHNFVRSMAAYSVISYLLQFKDRHNGNIMIDDEGHILHIDFGFCFDIAPGGVKFERAPFKLTSEMVAVMGGSTQSQAYAWFEELCVKAFLASRPYADKLGHMVTAMLASGLPCFKPDTLKHFKDRFVLDKTEREAAEYMRFLIKKSESSLSTVGYDQFQYYTNSIPYV